MQSVVFRPLPSVQNAAQFKLVEAKSENGSYPGLSWLEYRDLRERLAGFQSLLAFRMLPLNFGERGHEERVYAQMVSGNYFSTLGLQPQTGRFLREDEVRQPGGALVAVISHAFWRTHFKDGDDVVGKTLRLNDRVLTVVGVAPENFLGTVVGLKFDLWVPATLAPVLSTGSRELEVRDERGYSAMGRLRDGVSVAEAQAELDAAMRELTAHYPEANGGVRGEILPFWRAPRGAARFLFGALALMQGIMLLVLVVVCANAANLLIARASGRRREIGVRLALGARPVQIVRMLLIESLLLGAASAVVGTILAAWGVTALRAVPIPGALPVKFHTTLDWPDLAFTAALALAGALLFGLAPALRAAATDAQLAVRASGYRTGGGRVRSVLVSIEVALALFALTVAALFLRSFLEAKVAATGFRSDGVLLSAYEMRSGGYDGTGGLAATDELLHRLARVPGVEGVAIASWVPLDFHAMPQTAFALEGRLRVEGGQDRALAYTVTPGYFAVMGIPLVAGRDFAELNDREAPPQVVVNEAFVRRYGTEGGLIGRRLERNGTFKIVGVVRDSLYETFGEPPKPIVYFSYRDRFRRSGQIHLRVRGPEAAMAPTVRRIVRDFDSTISVYDVRTLDEHVDKNLFFRRIPARIFVVVGPLILGLAAMAIYAMVAYAVARRTMEIGIRLALGASQRGVITQIVGESLGAVMKGVVPAAGLSALVMMHLRGGTLNVATLMVVSAGLVAVAAFAAWLPARRAAKVDPMMALRCE
jgi:predicted permease